MLHKYYSFDASLDRQAFNAILFVNLGGGGDESVNKMVPVILVK